MFERIKKIFKKDSGIGRRGRYQTGYTKAQISAIKEQLKRYSDDFYYSVYYEMPFAKKIVDLIVFDVMQTGSHIAINEEQNDELDKVKEYLDNHIFNVLITARLYGNAGLLYIFDDGELDTPLNIDRLDKNSLKNVILYRNEQITIDTIDYDDMADKNHGNPLFYMLDDGCGNRKKVHYTRFLHVTGETDVKSTRDNYFFQLNGVSVLKKHLAILQQEYDLLKNIGGLVQKALVDILTIDNMYEKMCEIEESRRNGLEAPIDGYAVDAYVDEVTRFLDNQKMLVLDSSNKIERKPYNFAGLHDLSNHNIEIMAGIEDVPVERFASKTQAGLNNTGGNNHINYSYKIMGMQHHKVKPIYNYNELFLTKMFNGDVVYHFNNPLEQSESEKVDLQTRIITNASMLLTNGLVDIAGAKEYIDRQHNERLTDIVTEEELNIDINLIK